MRYFAICLLSLVLSACAYSQGAFGPSVQNARIIEKTYGPDGQEAFSLDCSGSELNWGACYKRAGEKCGTRGYDTLDKSIDNGSQAANAPVRYPSNGNKNSGSGQITQYNAMQSINAYNAGRAARMARLLPTRTMLISCKEENSTDRSD